MKLKQFAILGLLLVWATASYATFCPNNFNLIHSGDSLDSVKATCGKPTTEKTQDVTEPPDETNVPQEWDYYVQPDPTNTTTAKVTVAFNQGKVVNISLGGFGQPSISSCPGGTLSVGDSMATAKSVCGTPGMVNKSANNPEKPPAPVKVTVLTYTTANGPVDLTFRNGQMK